MLQRIEPLAFYDSLVPARSSPSSPILLSAGQIWSDGGTKRSKDSSILSAFGRTTTVEEDKEIVALPSTISGIDPLTVSNATTSLSQCWCSKLRNTSNKTYVVLGLRRPTYLSHLSLLLAAEKKHPVPEWIGIEVLTNVRPPTPETLSPFYTSPVSLAPHMTEIKLSETIGLTASKTLPWIRIAVLKGKEFATTEKLVRIDVKDVLAVRLSFKGFEKEVKSDASKKKEDALSRKYHAVQRCVLYEKLTILQRKSKKL